MHSKLMHTTDNSKYLAEARSLADSQNAFLVPYKLLSLNSIQHPWRDSTCPGVIEV